MKLRARRCYRNMPFPQTCLFLLLVLFVFIMSLDLKFKTDRAPVQNLKRGALFTGIPENKRTLATTPLRNITTTTTTLKVPINTYGCSKWFNNTFAENLQVIANYPRPSVTDLYFEKIDQNRKKPKQIMTSFPVIVTAASSSYFGPSQGLLKTVYERLLEKYPDLKVIYYDMGLKETQRAQIEEYCRICELRKFNFTDYPKHVSNLKSYTWKPIMIKKVLMEYGWVWWMDTSVRMTSGDLELPLEYSRRHSVLFFTHGESLSVAKQTDIQSMDYLLEDRCKFRHFGEIQATFVLFHFDDVTKTIIDAWTACALTEACMCPRGTSKKLGCILSRASDGRCHRFDQSILSILLRRLYHKQNDYPDVVTPFRIHDIRRGNSVQFFNVPKEYNN